jgi:hypothetical protein
MATQGPYSPGTLAAVTGNSGDVHWSNPGNAAASDNSYASAALGAAQWTHALAATNFPFTIPTGSTINLVTFEVERKSSGASCADYVDITYDGETLGWGYFAGDAVPTSDAYASYTDADLGVTLTVEDLNSSLFGWLFAVESNSGSARTITCDHIRVTVDYTPPPPADILISPSRRMQQYLVR